MANDISKISSNVKITNTNIRNNTNSSSELLSIKKEVIPEEVSFNIDSDITGYYRNEDVSPTNSVEGGMTFSTTGLDEISEKPINKLINSYADFNGSELTTEDKRIIQNLFRLNDYKANTIENIMSNNKSIIITFKDGITVTYNKEEYMVTSIQKNNIHINM